MQRPAAHSSSRLLLPLALALISAPLRAQELDAHYDGPAPYVNFGWAVASGEDLDGDGCDDVAIGVPYGDVWGSPEGNVVVYSGKTHQVLLTINSPLPAGSHANFGHSVAMAGDIDGDGTCDFVIGAPDYNTLDGYVGAFSGKYGTLLWGVYGQTYEMLGESVAAAGDVDGDGHRDVIVGGPGLSNAYLFGWNTGALHVFTASQSLSSFGWSVAGDVDVDGDGTMDVIVGAPHWNSTTVKRKDCGLVQVFSGATYASLFAATGSQPSDEIGWTVCGIGDVNSDRCSEVVAGAPMAHASDGYARLLDSSGATLGDYSGAPGSCCGWALARMRDVDGDHAADFLVGDLAEHAVLRSGGDGHVLHTYEPIDGNADRFGAALATGDVDGDGHPDVVVGDPYRDVGGNQGTGGVDVFVTRFASWTSYGPGWPGTLGIPSLVGVGAPGIGESFSIQLSDSCNTPTTALLFLGFAQISIPTNKGGTLLVVPSFTIPLAVPAAGVTLTGAIPDDSALIGLQLDAQAIETDAGASKGVSFTRGLEMDLGVDW